MEGTAQGASIGVAQAGGDGLDGEVGLAQQTFGTVAAGGVDFVAPGGARRGEAALEGARTGGEASGDGGKGELARGEFVEDRGAQRLLIGGDGAGAGEGELGVVPDQGAQLRIGAGGQVGDVEEGQLGVRGAEIDALGAEEIDEVLPGGGCAPAERDVDRRDRRPGGLAHSPQHGGEDEVLDRGQ
ncbi:hypothetical protein [Nocardia sp. No.11]|uniref:hypothetical protein n=1 Tax=Nocardia sp. No.11 TaxID=3128861 RepID=UPI00319E5A3F